MEVRENGGELDVSETTKRKGNHREKEKIPTRMQETSKADLRQLEGVMKETFPAADGHNNPEKDSASALQIFLDRIPISSIPGIKNTPGSSFMTQI